MPCYTPLVAYRPDLKKTDGCRRFVFNRDYALNPFLPQSLPCGQCVGCRLEYSRGWAVRMMHEASLWPQNCMITLTYDRDHLPDHGTVIPQEISDYVRSLRDSGLSLSFYGVAEYGDKNLRPHYHILIFGWRPPDCRFVEKSKTGFPLFMSEIASSHWGKGRVIINDMNFQTAAYCARYCLKKVKGKKRHEVDDLGLLPYEKMNPVTGEVVDILPESGRMSLRPAIGKRWFEKYWRDVYPADRVIVNGRPCQPPRYYDELLRQRDSDLYDKVKLRRRHKSLKFQNLLKRILKTDSLVRYNVDRMVIKEMTVAHKLPRSL